NETLAEIYKPQQPELADIDTNYIAIVIGLVKERATFIRDFWDLSHYFFVAPTHYDEKAFNKSVKEDTPMVLPDLVNTIQKVYDFTVANLENDIKGWITANSIGFGKVMMPLRLALVGALQGPDVFEIMFMVGKI